MAPGTPVSEGRAWGALLVLCIASRLLGAIYYIEDLDSLRFALAVVEYDVARLQPHFPAYPVFCFLAKAIYAVTGRYAVAFAILGGLSTFAILFFTLGLARIRLTTPPGLIAAFLLFSNPLLWLMSNRWMPDAMGLACALGVLWCMGGRERGRAAWGSSLAGLTLGVRLSCAPLVMPALLLRLRERGRRLWILGAGAAGAALWLVPLIAVTGWPELVQAALAQTRGHFTDFGGTLSTDPGLLPRSAALFRSLWADGFGLYWPGRHWATACTTVGLLAVVARRVSGSALLSAPFLGCLLYLGWILLYQNVLHKSRHVLPLLPFLALVSAFAGDWICRKGARWSRLVLALFLCCYGYVTVHLVAQHRSPTAIAQVHRHLTDRETGGLRVASVPLIKYYLSSQGLEAEYLSVESPEDLRAVGANAGGDLVAIGSPLPDRAPKAVRTFYHNPYVNRLWPELTVYEY